jgi:hypothetical protein
MFRNIKWAGAFVSVLVLCLSSAAIAAPSGAIFTTVEDGSEVNFNQYPSKEAVYLDGGPGPGAPQEAAGLDDGRYVFQVTDPSGKTLLSTDPAGNRQFDVVDGIIVNVVGTHLTGLDIDHGALTVQLMPYNDTPNNGGVYKVWVTLLADYLAGAQKLGVANGLAVVDAGYKPGNFHGFIPGDSKTDNFKVRKGPIVEIDCRFRINGKQVDGPGITWIDPLGASNEKFAYTAPELLVLTEAHVEACEEGLHTIIIDHGPGYKIKSIEKPDGKFLKGPGEVQVRIPREKGDLTICIYVEIELVP